MSRRSRQMRVKPPMIPSCINCGNINVLLTRDGFTCQDYCSPCKILKQQKEFFELKLRSTPRKEYADEFLQRENQKLKEYIDNKERNEENRDK